MVGNISSHHRLKRSLSLASVPVASVHFSSSLSYRRRFFVPEKGDGKSIHFPCSLTPCVARYERNDSGSNDDIECVKIFLFSYTHFLRIEERPILWEALGYAWASFETVPGRNPPSFKRIYFGSHHSELPTYYGLKRQRRCHVALDDLRTLGTCDGYTREAVCDVVMSLKRRRCSGGRKR